MYGVFVKLTSKKKLVKNSFPINRQHNIVKYRKDSIDLINKINSYKTLVRSCKLLF